MEGTANLVRGDDPLAMAARFVCESLDFAPVGFAVVRLDGVCVTVNQTLAGWVRPALPVAALHGQSLIHDVTDPLVGALRRARLGEAVVVDVDAAPLLAHRPGPWRLHVMPFRSGAGVRAASVTFEDRSEQQRTADAFEASERRFRLIVDAATDGVVVERNGIVLYANAAAARLLGYDKPEALVGRPLLEFVHPECVGAVRQGLAVLADLGRTTLDGQQLVRRDGVSVAVDITASRAPLDDSALRFVFFRDQSERKRMQVELERSNRMESLGRLAGSVAHDFNNLIGGIQTGIELAKLRAAGNPELAEALATAEAATHRASDVTRQLLTFSRGGEAAVTEVDVAHTVREVAQLMGSMNGKRIALELDLAPDACSAWIGSSQLYQIVLNLLLNARDAVDVDGSVRVWTRLEAIERGERAGEWLVLGVDDDGVGMDAATLACAFEPFFSTKAPAEGTGLGLSTVYGLVKQAGGAIVARAQPGQGARFRVYLPRGGATAPAAAPAPATDAVRPLSSSWSVLVCEDDPRLAMLTASLLEQMGYDAATVGTVDGALTALADDPERFDVVLLDVNLPPGNARDVLDRMKAEGFSLPVILTSGYAEEDVPADLIRDPQVTTYLPKPCPVERLAETIDQLLDTRSRS